jgi:hypothetical protein
MPTPTNCPFFPLSPFCATAWSNLAGAYKDSGRILEAIQAYRQAIALKVCGGGMGHRGSGFWDWVGAQFNRRS